MILEERKSIDQIEVLRNGDVQVREVIEILRDGVVFSSQYHRYVIGIDEDEPDLSRLDEDNLAVVLAARSPSRRNAAIQIRESGINEPTVLEYI